MPSFNFESEHQRQLKSEELRSAALEARAAADEAEREYRTFEQYSRVIGSEALGLAMIDDDLGDLMTIDLMDL